MSGTVCARSVARPDSARASTTPPTRHQTIHGNVRRTGRSSRSTLCDTGSRAMTCRLPAQAVAAAVPSPISPAAGRTSVMRKRLCRCVAVSHHPTWNTIHKSRATAQPRVCRTARATPAARATATIAQGSRPRWRSGRCCGSRAGWRCRRRCRSRRCRRFAATGRRRTRRRPSRFGSPPPPHARRASGRRGPHPNARCRRGRSRTGTPGCRSRRSSGRGRARAPRRRPRSKIAPPQLRA